MRLLVLFAAALFLTAAHAQAQVYAPYDGYEEYDPYGMMTLIARIPLLPITSQNLVIGSLCKNNGSHRRELEGEPSSSPHVSTP